MHVIRQNGSCSSPQNTDRIFYFDVLRALACLFVVVIHVSTKYVDQHIPGHFVAGNFFDSMARAGVPLFVMILVLLCWMRAIVFKSRNGSGTLEKWLYFLFFGLLHTALHFMFSGLGKMVQPLTQSPSFVISSRDIIIYGLFL